MALKIGFHIGPAGNMNGIGDYFRSLDSAGIPVFLKSVDVYGPIDELLLLGDESEVQHIAVYRPSTGPNGELNYFDVPDYTLSPDLAAFKHFTNIVAALPPEFDNEQVWLEPINEVDKNRSDWLGRFAVEFAKTAHISGYKVALFGFAAGEPEVSDWGTPGMLAYLSLCAALPHKTAVSLHEYSYNVESIVTGYPYLVGRFESLLNVCHNHNIPYPTILITEFGWEERNVPADTAHAMEDIYWANDLYSNYPSVLGASIWYLGGGFGNIADQTQRLIEPVTELALELGPPVYVPPPDPPPTGGEWVPVYDQWFDTMNESGDDWYNDGNRQIPTNWVLKVASGPNPLGNPDGNGSDWQEFEAKFLWDAFVPPEEHDQFLNERGYCYKMFAAQRPWAGKMETPATLSPGRYRLTIVYQDDCYDNSPPPKIAPADPLSFEFRLGCGHDLDFNDPLPWAISSFLTENVMSVEIVVMEDFTPAWFAFRARWGIVNPASFVKRFLVEEFIPEDPEPPPAERGYPRVQYHRKYVLLPPGTSLAKAIAATDVAHDPTNLWTVGYSADDAGVGNLDQRTVIAVNPGEWANGDESALRLFYEEYYPGIVYTFVNASSAAELKAKLSGEPWPPGLDEFRITHWPATSQEITQYFGARPEYYIQFGLPGHEGIDIHAPTGSPIYAAAAGTVYMVSDTRPPENEGGHNYGVHVRIEHTYGYKTIYAHLDSRVVNVGQNVAGGQIIGYADNTGNSDFSHLHITLKKEGSTASGETNYPNDQIDPFPYMMHLIDDVPPPPVTGAALFGLHSGADGNYTQEEVDLYTAGKIDIVKVLSSTDPQLIRQVDHDRPGSSWVVRAFLDFGGRNISPQQFFNDTISDVKRSLDQIMNGVGVVVELHNEPNLSFEGLYTSWNNGAEFGAWLSQVHALYKSELPSMNFIYPGLSPGVAIPDIRYFHYDFLGESANAASLCGGLGTHIYWNTLPDTPFTMQAGLNTLDHYLAMFPNLPVWITEASNNKQGRPQDKAAEYIQFWNKLKLRPQVIGVTYFVASASNPAFASEVWLGKGIAEIVGNR